MDYCFKSCNCVSKIDQICFKYKKYELKTHVLKLLTIFFYLFLKYFCIKSKIK